MDVDQGNVAYPIEAVKYQNGLMSFDLKLVSGSFDRTVKSDGAEISGEWKQSGRVISLVFKRAAK